MRGPPGSTIWLLQHEFRLFWFTLATGSAGARRRASWRLLAGGLLVWVLLHLAAFALVREAGPAAGGAPHGFVVTVSASLLATWLFMLSSALKKSVETLFDRGDMDLLLSSPLPSRSIFGAKLIGMTAGVALLYWFFLAPFAHVGLLLGHPRWLAVYPLLLSMAGVASACAMLLTLLLVRFLGARRTRVVAQVVGALAGALLFLLSQAATFVSGDQGGAPPSAIAGVMSAATRVPPDSMLLLPARAALGDGKAIVMVTLLALLTLASTLRLTHGFFARGLQQAASAGQVSQRPAKVVYRFDRSLMGAVLMKEWRLIWRDPHLISQVLLQLLYLVPLCFIVFRKSAFQLPAIGAGLTMLCASLAASLAWIIVVAEDAPDLLHTAPANTGTIKRAKMAAAIVPVLALVALPLLWLVFRTPAGGALLAATVAGATATSACIALWAGKTMPRRDFGTRNKNGMAGSLLEVCNQLVWGALALQLLYVAGGGAISLAVAAGMGAAFAIALGLPGLALLVHLRRR